LTISGSGLSSSRSPSLRKSSSTTLKNISNRTGIGSASGGGGATFEPLSRLGEMELREKHPKFWRNKVRIDMRKRKMATGSSSFFPGNASCIDRGASNPVALSKYLATLRFGGEVSEFGKDRGDDGLPLPRVICDLREAASSDGADSRSSDASDDRDEGGGGKDFKKFDGIVLSYRKIFRKVGSSNRGAPLRVNSTVDLASASSTGCSAEEGAGFDDSMESSVRDSSSSSEKREINQLLQRYKVVGVEEVEKVSEKNKQTNNEARPFSFLWSPSRCF